MSRLVYKQIKRWWGYFLSHGRPSFLFEGVIQCIFKNVVAGNLGCSKVLEGKYPLPLPLDVYGPGCILSAFIFVPG